MVIHKEFSKQKLLLKNAADAILAGESKFVLTIFEKKKKKKTRLNLSQGSVTVL